MPTGSRVKIAPEQTARFVAQEPLNGAQTRKRRTSKRRNASQHRFTVLVKGTEVKRLRKKNKWTQVDLSEKSGVSVRKIQSLEAGDPALPRATIQPVADALGVERNDLFRGPKVPDPPRIEGEQYDVLKIRVKGNLPTDAEIARFVGHLSAENPGVTIYLLILAARSSSSYEIDLEVRRKDATKIIQAFKKGAYDKLGVTSIQHGSKTHFKSFMLDESAAAQEMFFKKKAALTVSTVVDREAQQALVKILLKLDAKLTQHKRK
jgi:transcriptional regulator with XRE-family HTH domain